MEQYTVAEKFIGWMERKILIAGRGDDLDSLDVEPSGKFWFGRIAPEKHVIELGLGDRGERLEPCAIGIRVRPTQPGPWEFKVYISAVAWLYQDGLWRKSDRYSQSFTVSIDLNDLSKDYHETEIRKGLTQIVGVEGLSAKIQVDRKKTEGHDELTILMVNTADMTTTKALKDTRLYETHLGFEGLELAPFMLESLPDSFRYDRKIWAYGINTGVNIISKSHAQTLDSFGASKMRPEFWPKGYAEPDLRFDVLAVDPIGPAIQLIETLAAWGKANWSTRALDDMAIRDQWSPDMRAEADSEATEFYKELERIRNGLKGLQEDANLMKSFCLMNKAMSISAHGKYESWRSFQIGFLLANLSCIPNPEKESGTVDIVWFATGGGKTETYLGLIVTAAIYDRLRGKISGLTAWSRFPLRMLSLQQTQRFANALAAAEIVRRGEGIAGDPFSMGFLVGQSATPNSIDPEAKKNDPWDPDDDQMPNRLKVLERCPFCRHDKIEMVFNRKLWKLEHRCKNDKCPWPEESLPFYLVDDEIYRFLPTVIVGTLDKAASISMQASMRGLVGAPWGKCSKEGHGYVYAPRSKRPKGCMVPGCDSPTHGLPQATELYGPSFRLQDELHLLRDSLGAVDAHYEAVFDGLQYELTGKHPKILASSATLTGYEKQSDVLYRRGARVFPKQGPSISQGFWSNDTERLMRRYVAIAPRGVTIEYTVDRLLTELQNCLRELQENPKKVCVEIGVPEDHADFLVSIYGTNVVYGNTLKDLDAVQRSMETQVAVKGNLGTGSLTGRTDFEDVRDILRRLEEPEADFYERLHLITASSMMSHGVDIDRLNVMVMLGLPLGSAEFIQTTARVGRKWPGLIFVVHKIGRERDASVFRSFGKFIEQGDRFVDPVPITRRSRRVLDRTIAGLILARVLAIHEPQSKFALTTPKNLKKYIDSASFSAEDEANVLESYLGLACALDEPLKKDIQKWLQNFLRNVADPPTDARFVSDLSPTGAPMRSLRDVEEQVPIYGSEIR